MDRMDKNLSLITDNATALVVGTGLTVSPRVRASAEKIFAAGKDWVCPAKFSDGDKLFGRIVAAFALPEDGYDITAFTALNAFIFDGNPEAGKLRTKDAVVDGSSFADKSLIPGSLKRLLSKMEDLPRTPDGSKEDFAAKLTHYFFELFILCPFACGSFITQAVFLSKAAFDHGYWLNYEKCGGKALSSAAKTAFLTDEKSELFLCLSNAISYPSEGGGKEKPRPAVNPQRQLRKKPVQKPQSVSSEEKKKSKTKLFDLPASVLLEAAKIKQQIEELESRLASLVNSAEEKKEDKKDKPKEVKKTPRSAAKCDSRPSDSDDGK